MLNDTIITSTKDYIYSYPSTALDNLGPRTALGTCCPGTLNMFRRDLARTALDIFFCVYRGGPDCLGFLGMVGFANPLLSADEAESRFTPISGEASGVFKNARPLF